VFLTEEKKLSVELDVKRGDTYSMNKKYKNGLHPRRPGTGNFPFYKKPYDIAYAKPGYSIRGSKKEPRKFVKKKYDVDSHLPF